MTRKEHLEFCKKCTNRKFDSKQGLICNLTGCIADFNENCKNFKLDDTVIEKVDETEKIYNEEVIPKLDDDVINRLKVHQDFSYAIVGGLLATLISAIIWAIVTVATQYQIGFMAVGVGLLVGYSVQFFGAGIDKKFGYLGAVFSLLGCLLGNLFGQVGFVAQEQYLGYFETLTYLNPNLIISILVESFSPIDLLFYGIAIYEGYKFAFRRISANEIMKIQSEDSEGYPLNYKARIPLFVVSVVLIGLFILKINQGVSGFKTFQYESGKKMSEGEMVNSKEQGKWVYWYENGNTQSIGFYSNGIPDSLWQWFNESGKISRIGNYKKGLEHGVWMSYYENGFLSDSGCYIEGRMNGEWKYLFEDGSLFQSGYFKRNQPDSIWKTYFGDGKLNSIGKMVNGELSGLWANYYENGQIASQIKYLEDNKTLIENAWDIDGNQSVLNGIGLYKAYSITGQVVEQGEVKNGLRTGKWITYFENGKINEEGVYENEIYRIINSWDLHGKQNVKEGNGLYVAYYPDGEYILETGLIQNGLKEGEWKTYYESSEIVYQEQNYKNGKLSGIQKVYFESNQLYTYGEMIDGQKQGEWNWYYENGNISSSVKFDNDNKEGEQIIWSEVGEITKKEHYKNGRLIKEEIL